MRPRGRRAAGLHVSLSENAGRGTPRPSPLDGAGACDGHIVRTREGGSPFRLPFDFATQTELQSLQLVQHVVVEVSECGRVGVHLVLLKTLERIDDLAQLFDGAPGALVLQLIESERLTPEELNQLRELIARLDSAAN